MEMNINIYDPNDPAFVNRCYITSNTFPYDLTQKYRYEILFQRKAIIPSTDDINNNTCVIYNIDNLLQKIILKCLLQSNENNNFFYYIQESLSLNNTI